MNRKFQPGKRLMRMKNFTILACWVVVFVFYFIYDYLFRDMFPQLMGLPLAILFILFGLVVYKAVNFVYNKYAEGTYYIITNDALVVGHGKREVKYSSKQFQKATINQNSLHGVCPVVFHVGKEELRLNQYVEDIYELVDRILKRIEPYAQIDQELKARTDAMKGVY